MGQYLISDEQVGCDLYYHCCVWCQMCIVSLLSFQLKGIQVRKKQEVVAALFY